MAIEGRRDTVIYKVMVPIAGAILGALAATWMRAAQVDNAQLHDVIALLKDPALSGNQKIQALAMYKEITDRPWSIIRSLVTTATVLGTAIGFAFAFRMQNRPYDK